MRRASAGIAALVGLSLIASPSLAGEKSSLLHNGSGVIAEVSGQEMSIYYSKPRTGLLEVGISAGTLLFRGSVLDGNIKGVAFAFRKNCPPEPYDVQGRAHGDVGFELTGPGPMFGPACKVSGSSWKSPHSRLVFWADNSLNE